MEQKFHSQEVAIRKYRNDGFWILRRAFKSSDLQHIQQEIIAFQNNKYSVPWINSSNQYPQSVNAVHFPHRVSEVIWTLALNPIITSWAALFAGSHLIDWDERICLVQSMLYIKGPDTKGQSWHQDERFTPTRDRSLITVWVAIDTANQSNGCIWVLPGSHRKGQIFSTIPIIDSEDWVKSEIVQVDTTGAIPIELEAGDVVFFSGYLVHGSFRNKTHSTRKSLVLNYQSLWSPRLVEATCEHGTPIDFLNISEAQVIDVTQPESFYRSEAGVLAR